MHVAERVADRAHPLADPQLSESPSGAAGRGPRAVDLEQRDVDRRVGADDLAAERAAVGQRDRDPVGALDDVVIREDVAVGIDDEAAARALARRSRVARAGPSTVVAAGRRARLAAVARDAASMLTTAALIALGDVGEVDQRRHAGSRRRAGCGAACRRRRAARRPRRPARTPRAATSAPITTGDGTAERDGHDAVSAAHASYG